jgi:hypothetical protein
MKEIWTYIQIAITAIGGKRIIRACMETTLELWDNSLNQSL